jgi:hypothetical protein
MSSKNSIAGVRQRRAGEPAPIVGRNAPQQGQGQRPQFAPQYAPQQGQGQRPQFAPQQGQRPQFAPQYAPQQGQQYAPQQGQQFAPQQGQQFAPQQGQQFAPQQGQQFAPQQGQQFAPQQEGAQYGQPLLQRQTNQQNIQKTIGQFISNVPQSGPEQIGNGPGKLSVSDAFALVTLRLGRLETFMNKYNLDTKNGENDDIKIDNSVIKSVINRLEKLEENSENNSNQNNLSTVNESIEEENENFKNEIISLKNEVAFLKDSLAKLETITMDTNTKLVELYIDNENKENKDLFFSNNFKENSFPGFMNFPISIYSLDDNQHNILNIESSLIEDEEEINNESEDNDLDVEKVETKDFDTPCLLTVN